MWFWNRKKKKDNKRTTFDFTELEQTNFPNNISNINDLMNNPFRHGINEIESQENDTTFGGGDFGGAGAESSWSDSSDSGGDD